MKKMKKSLRDDLTSVEQIKILVKSLLPPSSFDVV